MGGLVPPFFLGELYGDARMGMARLFGFCASLFFASSVAAANIIDLGPSDYRSWGSGTYSHTGSGIRSSVGQTVRMPPMNTSLPVSRNPVIPYGSVANGMRNFVRITPGSALASAAVTGLFLAMDWYFDHDMGEWVKDGEPVLDDPEFGLWSIPSTDMSFPTPDAACSALVDQLNATNPNLSYEYGRYEITSTTRANCRGDRTLISNGVVTPDIIVGHIDRTFNCPANYTYQPSTGLCLGAALPVPLTGSDFSELEAYLPTALPSPVGNSARDTQVLIGGSLPGYHDTTITGPSSVSGPGTTSTSTDPVTGDTIVTNTSTTTNISYGDTTITTTNTTTSTSYQNGQETSTTVTTDTPGELPVSSGAASGDWPGFCDWASVVCDWLNWTQEDPPPDSDLPPVIDDDFFEQKNISFGAKSCPPDYEVNLTPFLATTVGVSFQPLCDFAGLIYYMVMSASYIIAAYISIGVARNA